MAGTKKKRAKKKNPSKKGAVSRPRKKNPKRSSARRASPKKRNPGKRSSARRASPKKRNPGKRSSARRARRTKNNPGWGNTKVLLTALAAGVGASVASAYIGDGPLGNRTPGMRNLAILGESLAAVYWIEDPVIASAVLVGLNLIPIAKVVYQMLPMMANPMPMGAPPPIAYVAGPVVSVSAAAPVNGAATSMSALHRQQSNIRALRAKDRAYGGQQMAALHRGMGALHMNALHMNALHKAPAPQMQALRTTRGFAARYTR